MNNRQLRLRRHARLTGVLSTMLLATAALSAGFGCGNTSATAAPNDTQMRQAFKDSGTKPIPPGFKKKMDEALKRGFGPRPAGTTSAPTQ